MLLYKVYIVAYYLIVEIMFYNRMDLLNHAIQKANDNDFSESTQKRIIKSAHTLFDRNAVQTFMWSNTFTLLNCYILDKKKLYQVGLRINPNNKNIIDFRCACGEYDPYCKHIICVFMTIQYLMEGMDEYGYATPEDHKLQYTLSYGNCDDDSISFPNVTDTLILCLFPIPSTEDLFFTKLGVYVVKSGKIIDSDDPLLSVSLKNITKATYSVDFNKQFVKHMTAIGNKYPLYIYHDEIWHRTMWNNHLQVNAVTEIAIGEGDTMHIRRLASHKTKILNDFIKISSDLIFDKKTNSIGTIIHDTKGAYRAWELADRWQLMSSEQLPSIVAFPSISNTFEIDATLFNKNPIISEKENKHFLDAFVFKNNGVVIKTLTPYTPHIKMTIQENPYTNNLSMLHSDIYAQDVRLFFAFSCNTAIKKAFNIFNHFPNINTQAKQAWRKGVLAVICAQTKETCTAAIDSVGLAFESHDNNIQKTIRKNLVELNHKIRKHSATQVFFENDQLYIAQVEHRVFWLLHALPMHFFGEHPYQSAMDAPCVATSALHKSLTTFKEFLDQYSIELYLDKKRIKTAGIKISIDSGTNPTTDWFELHPNVQYDKQKLSEKDWQHIVANNGILETDTEIIITDSTTRAALTILSRWATHEKKKDNEAKERSIVIVPRLKMLDFLELRKNGVEIQLSREDEKTIQSLSHFKSIPQMPIPQKLQCTLREYQKDGYNWLAFLYKHRFGACLADDMGLGKTVQAISLLSALHEGIIESMHNKTQEKTRRPHLIVVPSSLVFNWINEINNFYPHMHVQEYITTKKNTDFDTADIFITTYDIVRRDIDNLQTIRFDIIIFDEAQAIKNITAQRTTSARLLQGNFKLCITGTPLENHIGEYYSIMDLAVPGLLADYNTFRRSGGDSASIVQQTRPFILRRTKDVISQELPEKIESDVYFDMTEKQKTLYTRISQEIRNEVAKAYDTKTKGQASIIALTALLRLRQICISPDLVIPAQKATPSPKIEYIGDQLQELAAQGHASLVFSQFTACLDIVEQELKKLGISYARIDGSVPTTKRKDIIESFQNGTTVDVLLMSLKTGGVGLNLTRASYVFHVDPWWNAAVENQASDRVHRIGQQKRVIVTRLLMHHSIEEKMLTLKKHKLELFKAIVEGAGDKTNSQLSKNDFDFLLN